MCRDLNGLPDHSRGPRACSGRSLGALNHIALRDDAPALALRGIAMAQLGDLVRAKRLLRRAARAFGPREAVARARCVVAEAEIALVSRDLNWPVKALDAARDVLETARRPRQCRACALSQDPPSASDRPSRRGRARARRVSIPRHCHRHHARPRTGRCRHRDAAAADQGGARGAGAGRTRRATRPASRRSRPKSRARPLALDTPAARLIARGKERPLLLDDIETLLASKALVVDACRHVVATPAR